MKKALLSAARRLRHAGPLERAEGFWSLVRPAYQWVLEFGGGGVPVDVAGACTVRMPGRAVAFDWQRYEVEAITAYVDWLQAHPDAAVLDVGCSNGIYSLIALTIAPHSRAVAIDADAPSLMAVQQMLRFVRDRDGRLDLVHALVADARVPSQQTLSEVLARTASTLAALPRDSVTRYVTLDEIGRGEVPVLPLDDFSAELKSTPRPILVKCDVEGAELAVLKGAEGLLSELRPVILLSVHPSELQRYHGTPDDIIAFLTTRGYRIAVLGIDHEEHWWCVPG